MTNAAFESVTARDMSSPSPATANPSERDAVSSRKPPIIWIQPAKSGLTVEAARGASAQAIVSEIQTCAKVFFETGEDASIDLRCLKSMPEEREILASMLGVGEVSAVVDTAGRSEVRETSVPCVWWIRHHNHEGETVGELIEITAVPDLIVGDRNAVARGLKSLDAALQLNLAGTAHHS